MGNAYRKLAKKALVKCRIDGNLYVTFRGISGDTLKKFNARAVYIIRLRETNVSRISAFYFGAHNFLNLTPMESLLKR